MKIRLSCLLVLCFASVSIHGTPMGTAFSYQGFLSGAGSPATGSYDFIFSLYDAASDGNQIGQTLTNTAVPVNNGLFLVTLDFQDVFDGSARWLALGVRTNGSSGAFTALTPLQELTPTPYSLYASNASGASPGSGSVTASSLNTPGGSPASGEVLGYNGTNLVWISGSGGGSSSNGWSLTGNAGTSPASGNFIGTTDDNPLELHVNSVRALQLMPTTDAPNVIGGAQGNYVSSGVIGATIGGGGTITLYGHAYSNSIFADNATIGGGLGNTIQTLSYESTISGGDQNIITNNANDSCIGGGRANTILADSPYSVISGGESNEVVAEFATIGGGQYSQAGGKYSTVGGGFENYATGPGATIGGGGYEGDSITFANSAEGAASTIAGGVGNQIISGCLGSSIGGGRANVIQSLEATIGGGYLNGIASGAEYSTIGGGNQNNVDTGAYDSVIAGGAVNVIQGSGLYSTIAGGQNNTLDARNAFIGGGFENDIYGVASNSVIAGGFANYDNGGPEGTIGGGQVNAIGPGSSYGTIPGGYGNIVDGEGGFAAGEYAMAGQGCFVWSDGSNSTSSTTNEQFMARASGGFVFYTSPYNAGAELPAGSGSWAPLSDRNAKENFEPVNPLSVLAKVAALPVTTWNYKAQAQSIRHIGPMAQDFYAAFEVGENDTHIPTIDEEGVALAAIKGLNTKLEEAMKEKDTKIAQMEKELAEVKSSQQQTKDQWEARFEALQKAVARVADKSDGALAVTSSTPGQK
jgi:trimeric autotransporter adhesin